VSVTGVSLALDLTEVTLYRLETRRFTATVSGTSRTEVTWTASCGTVAANGLVADWTAPNLPGECTVTAASGVDPSATASVQATVQADWVIRSLDDVDDGACTPAHCSLREALNAAQAEPGPAVIRLADAVVASRLAAGLAHATSVVIPLQAALPTITTPVDIVGPGAGLLTIDANATPQSPRRTFSFDGDFEASVSGLTLRGGKMTGGGGAVLVTGGADVTLDAIVITDNEVLTGPGSGILVKGQSAVTLEDSRIDGNRALDPGILVTGGALSVTAGGSADMRGGSISHNQAALSFLGGGAAITDGTLRLNAVAVVGNEAGGGTALYVAGPSTVDIVGGSLSEHTSSPAILIRGVDIVNGQNLPPGTPPVVTMTGVTVAANEGRAILLSTPYADVLPSLTFEGGSLTENGTGLDLSGGTAILSNTTVTSNSLGIAASFGDLELRSVRVVANSGSLGGGLNIEDFASVRIMDSEIANNSATTGGGILVQGAFSMPTLSIVNSAIAGNTATGEGGGIRVGPNTMTTLSGSTISGNSARVGGGVVLYGAATLTNVTIANNTAADFGGGLAAPTLGFGTTNPQVPLGNTLLVANTRNGLPSNCERGSPSNSVMILSGGNNLSDDDTCASFLSLGSDLHNGNGGILPLGDNGGPTPTHALLQVSQAINAGNPALCPASDQRGYGRMGVCDIGAFEFGGIAPAPARLSLRIHPRF
jgi:CSLREA domain-containing protein